MTDSLKEELIEFIKNCKGMGEIRELFGYSPKTTNARTAKKIRDNVIDITGHEPKHWLTLGKYITKSCPVCDTEFTRARSHEGTTCSISCSNTHFRTGVNNGNWKESSYRSTCFHYHPKECIICGENVIVEVHHFDEDHDNNVSENLIPLCPTHHKYWHSGNRHLIEEQVIEYRNNYIKTLDN